MGMGCLYHLMRKGKQTDEINKEEEIKFCEDSYWLNNGQIKM